MRTDGRPVSVSGYVTVPVSRGRESLDDKTGITDRRHGVNMDRMTTKKTASVTAAFQKSLPLVVDT